ncbi:MAG: hypothetical protein HN416_15025 [Nitrospina sp.]|nr:hypothetical protein [Nitrospina sp.]
MSIHQSKIHKNVCDMGKSFHRNAFCQIAGFIDIPFKEFSAVISQQLTGDYGQHGCQKVQEMRYLDDIVR